MIRSSEDGLSGILEAEQLRRAQDLAAVERRDLQPLQALVRGLLEQVVAVAGGDEPEEVEHLDGAVVLRHADLREVLVHAVAQRLVALSWKFACRRLSVQTLQTVISVSQPVASE